MRVWVVGGLLLLGSACSSADATGTRVPIPTAPLPTPPPTLPEVNLDTRVEAAITVEDQVVINDSVTVAMVVSRVPGWLSVHTDRDGDPGPVIGVAPIEMGQTVDLVVQIDTSELTPFLIAMLHVDEGLLGVYEFPGADRPQFDVLANLILARFAINP